MGRQLPAQPWTGENAQLWDTITFGGKSCPGVAKVSVKRSNKWDDKKSKGSHGGDREFSGADNAKVKITIRMLTDEEHEEFKKDILPLIEPTPGKKKPDGLPLIHPVSVARKVDAITIDDVDGPNTDGGTIDYAIDATELRKPDKKNATGTPGVGGGSSSRFAPAQECGSLKSQLGALTAELQAEMQINTALRLKRAMLLEEARRTDVSNQVLSDVGAQTQSTTGQQATVERNAADIQASDARLRRISDNQEEVARRMGALRCNATPPSQNAKVVGEAA